MLNDKMVRGTNFTCFHAGSKDGWTQFRLEPPDVPVPIQGKSCSSATCWGRRAWRCR